MTQVDIHAEEYTVKKQAKQAAIDQIQYSMDELIDPSDIDENADNWEDIDEDTLNMEVGEGIQVMVSENQIPAIKDLSVVLWRESLPRVPMKDLVFDDMETAVREGYWPNSMNRIEVTEILWEYFPECEHCVDLYNEAEDYLYSAIDAAYHPLKEPDV